MVSVVGLFWRAWAHVFYFCGIFISHQIRGRSDKGISSSSLKKLCCCENKYAVFTGKKNVEEDVHQKGKNPGLHALKNGWKKKNAWNFNVLAFVILSMSKQLWALLQLEGLQSEAAATHRCEIVKEGQGLEKLKSEWATGTQASLLWSSWRFGKVCSSLVPSQVKY